MVYRPGKQNALADSLSRFPLEETEEPVLNIHSAPLFFTPKLDLVQMQADDKFCSNILSVLKDPTNSSYRNRMLFYVIKEGVLYRKVIRDNRAHLLLVVPKKLWPQLLEEAHDSILSGHLGIARTYERIKDRYFFPGQIESVARYVASCESCQHRNDPAKKPGGFLQPLRVSGPFVRIHMDYCGPFTLSKKRNKYILLAVCPMTKYITVKPVPRATAAVAAQFLVNNIVLIHGCVREIFTDRGKHFTSHVVQEILRLLDIKHLLTTSYHAQADGAAERALKTFVNIISHYTSIDQQNWDEVCPFAAFVMNTYKSETTGYSPFELVFGRPPVHPVDVAFGYSGFQEFSDPEKYTETVKSWLEKAHEVALAKVNSTHDKEAPRFNAKRSDSLDFEPDDLVLEWRPVSGEGLTTKLLRKWTGPLRVVAKVGPVDYKIQPLSGKRKPYVVHVERLKPYHERLDDTEEISPEIIPPFLPESAASDSSGTEQNSFENPSDPDYDASESSSSQSEATPAEPRQTVRRSSRVPKPVARLVDQV